MPSVMVCLPPVGASSNGNHKSFQTGIMVKTATVDAELEKLDLNLRRQRSAKRMVSASAYEAGSAAGASLAINPGIEKAPRR